MSHLAERKEKICLNCGSYLTGRFCHKCGQENLEPKESLWHLVSHFINDVTHFDGKFFSSLKYLITKPGFLSKEYIIGRRASYLNPIRMYLFTSAIFFLVFFSIFNANIGSPLNPKNNDDILKMDSISFQKLVNDDNNGVPISREALKEKLDTGFQIQFGTDKYRSRHEYDSLIKTGRIKDNWFVKKLIYRELEVVDKYKHDRTGFIKIFIEKFVHRFPQLLFVLLPLFALILKLIYIRRKNYYYTDHLIFSLHTYIFVFIAMLVIFGINKLHSILHWGWLDYISGALVLIIFFYFYKSLRNFYAQRRAKTIFKFFIILFLLLFITLLLFFLFFFLSLFQL